MLTRLLTFCLRMNRFCLRADLVLRGACAGLRAPQFCLHHTLTKGPLAQHKHKGLEHASYDIISMGFSLSEPSIIIHLSGVPPSFLDSPQRCPPGALPEPGGLHQQLSIDGRRTHVLVDELQPAGPEASQGRRQRLKQKKTMGKKRKAG